MVYVYTFSHTTVLEKKQLPRNFPRSLFFAHLLSRNSPGNKRITYVMQ